jgi:DNA-binding CsgD family transcriptional regulator
VAAQLLAREQAVDANPPSARVHLSDGLWVTLRAARIEKGPTADASAIAVSIELTPPADRSGLYASVAGLSDRETELLHQLVGGADTRELAQRLFISEHTVQDHLKSIFAKTGVNTRRKLIARATGLAG